MAANLEKFACLRCNECCRQPGFVYLRNGEEASMAAFLGLETFEFVNQYCELEERRWLVLKKKPQSEDCIFLTETGCSIHPAKPEQCRDFPKRWRTVRSFDYCEGLKAL